MNALAMLALLALVACSTKKTDKTDKTDEDAQHAVCRGWVANEQRCEPSVVRPMHDGRPETDEERVHGCVVLLDEHAYYGSAGAEMYKALNATVTCEAKSATCDDYKRCRTPGP